MENEIILEGPNQLKEGQFDIHLQYAEAGSDNSNTNFGNGSNQTSFLDKIYKLQIENNLLLTNIAKKLEKIELTSAHNKISTQNFLTLQEKIPLRTVDDLIDFDKELLDPDFNAVFLKFIKGIGGSSSKDFIHRCLRTVYKNELAVKCSWLGLRGNHKISSTTSMNLVKAVIKEACASITDEFEKIGSEWFRLAKVRLTKVVQQI